MNNKILFITISMVSVFLFSSIIFAQGATDMTDLKIVDLKNNPAKGVINQPININCVFTNSGMVTSGTWTAVLLLNGAPIHNQDFTMTPVTNTYQKLSYTWTPNDEGTYTFTCKLDTNNTIVEKLENNNEKSISVIVEPEPIDFGMEEVRTNKEKYVEHDVWATVMVKCIYFGTGVTDATMPTLKVKAYLGDGSKVSETKRVHTANGIAEFNLKTMFQKSGDLKVGCILDPDNTINDTNRSNNKKEKTVELVDPQELVQKIINHTFRIILYEDINFSGEQKVYEVQSKGYKSVMYFGGGNGFRNNKLSSIKVPDGCRVTLYSRENLKGDKENFTQNDNWLGDNSIGNDKASSMEIRCGLYDPK